MDGGRRPWLHLAPHRWDALRDRLANHPTPAYRLCRDDMRPSTLRPPRTVAAVVESAAFVAAVTGLRSDVDWLRTHLRLLVAEDPKTPTVAGTDLAALAWAYDILDDVLPAAEYAAWGATLGARAAAAHDMLIGLEGGPSNPDAVALAAGLRLAARALGPDEAEAAWLASTEPRLTATLAEVATDGWWPTGLDDWHLLLPLLTRVADAEERATKADWFDRGLFREAWRVALHGLAPAMDDGLDLDRAGRHDLPRAEALADDRPGAHVRWVTEPAFWPLLALARRAPEEPGWRAAVQAWRAADLGRGTPFAVLFGGDDLPRREPSGRIYHVFDQRGMAVWRSSWTRGAQLVALATGPAPGATHADANHLLLWADGQPLVSDTGDLTHPGSEWHNTVMVDGRGQLMPALRPPTGAYLEAAWLSEVGGCLVGQASGAYPPEAGVRTFTRHVGFAGGYCVVWDVLAAERPVAWEWRLHTPGALTTLDGGRARLGGPPGGLVVHALRPDRLQLATEEAREKADGPLVARRLRLTTNAPVARTQFLVVLASTADGATEAPGATLVTDEDTVGATLRLPGGLEEDVLFPTQDRGIVLPNLICDAGYLALRRDGRGQWTQLIARRVTRLLVPGGELLSSTQPVDVALLADGENVRGEIDSATGATVTLRCPFRPWNVLVDGQPARARVTRPERLAAVRLTSGRHQVWVSAR